ncbi:TetR/AcrR family transcriptional regulator [Anaerocolumna sp. MB42-C2]|uniref:TetR/AcrR family transcriptional regulator n=1 Tax=Anaerocolumna sp. MB42-C2 TaxID=3070997 RepID=UPI0027E0B6EA|nr:TetR/AcrR family transcriptional regulator [Anaerocolumna sp. MB42-C2]WMJ89958.1 TetR/AcrR family transcriptional regulator [Anaerocolumna sp. MB42-C2]
MDAKEIKRNEISIAAKELFTDYGYKSVSMDQIAQKANVAKGTLYLYFKDKEDLFLYLANGFIKEFDSYVEGIVNKKLSLVDEIHEVIYNLLMYRKKQEFLYKIVKEAKEFRTQISCKVIDMLDNTISVYLEKRLKNAVEKGLIKPCNTTLLTFLVLKVYTALAFEWEEKHEPLNEREIADSVGSFLKQGLFL